MSNEEIARSCERQIKELLALAASNVEPIATELGLRRIRELEIGDLDGYGWGWCLDFAVPELEADETVYNVGLQLWCGITIGPVNPSLALSVFSFGQLLATVSRPIVPADSKGIQAALSAFAPHLHPGWVAQFKQEMAAFGHSGVPLEEGYSREPRLYAD